MRTVELETNGRGDPLVWVVWVQHPVSGRQELAAVCTSETKANVKAAHMKRAGGITLVEGGVPLDHTFGGSVG